MQINGHTLFRYCAWEHSTYSHSGIEFNSQSFALMPLHAYSVKRNLFASYDSLAALTMHAGTCYTFGGAFDEADLLNAG